MAGGNERRPRTDAEMLDYLRTNVYRQKGSDCLLWAGFTDRHGNPRVHWKHRHFSARRLLLVLARGAALHPRLLVTPTCHERLCMNEEHLKVVTKRTVSELARERGTLHGGTAHALAQAMSKARKGARLPITQREEVLRMRAQGMTFDQIGERYGVSGAGVHNALTRWSRIYGDGR